jgi:hypothetical protein
LGKPRTNNRANSTFPADDPYYCGLRARIPNFVKSKSKKKAGAPQQTMPTGAGAKEAMGKAKPGDVMLTGPVSLPPQIPSHPFWWHSRLYNDPGQQMSEFTVTHDAQNVYVVHTVSITNNANCFNSTALRKCADN